MGVVERGIAVSYKYNPLASVPVPEICVPVLCSRAQKVAVIVIKRKCRLIPDLPAPVAQLFVPGGSVDIMTNATHWGQPDPNALCTWSKDRSPPWQPEPLLHQGDQRSEGGWWLEQLCAAVPVRGARNPESSSCGAWGERCDFLHTCYLCSHPFSSQEPGTMP